MNTAGQTENRTAGYAMAALLVAIAVLAMAMTVALPAWRQAGQREKEEELVFRGRQYVRAIQLYQRKFAAAYPADADILVKQKFLRKKYLDPMVQDGAFELVYQGSPAAILLGQGSGGATPGQGRGAGALGQQAGRGGLTPAGPAARGVGPRGGVLGVRSKSTEASIRTYNGATHYNEWLFVFVPAVTGPGQARPGTRGGPGLPGGRGGPGTGPPGSVPGVPPGGVRGGRGLDR
jgi:type II secretory pathway pseudopilin PulG